MPPALEPCQNRRLAPDHMTRPPYDPAQRHPIFFTDRLHRLPFPAPVDARAREVHPVTHGYVWNSRPTTEAGGTKL